MHGTMNLGETIAVGGQAPSFAIPDWVAAAKETNAKAASLGEVGGDHDAHRFLGKFSTQQHTRNLTYKAMDTKHLQMAMSLAPLSVELPILIAKYHMENGEHDAASQYTEHTVSLLLEAHGNPLIGSSTTLRFAIEVAKLAKQLEREDWVRLMANLLPAELAAQLGRYSLAASGGQGPVMVP